MRTTVITATTALALAGAVLVAAPADAAGHRGVTKFHSTSKHTVAIGHKLQPGVVHFRNTGKAPVLIIRAKKHNGVAALAKALNDTSAKAEQRAFKKFDFIEVALPKADSWVRLGKGTYYVVDATTNKIKASRIGTVKVTGHTRNAVVPAARSLVFGSRNTVPASTTLAAKSAVRVVNHASHLSGALFLPVKSSVSDADIKNVVAHPSDDGVFNSVVSDRFDVFPAVAGPRHTVTVTTKLRAGRYLLINLRGGDSFRAGDVGLVTVR